MKKNTEKILKGILIYAGAIVYLTLNIYISYLVLEIFIDPCQHLGWYIFSEIIVFIIVILIVSFLYGCVKHTKKNELLKRIATFPDKHNYNWQGGYSIFSFLVLGITTIFRTMSCLQLCKYLYRNWLSVGKDIKSKRPNVSPLFQEGYYICWFAFLIFQLIFKINNSITCGLNLYFIIESLTWIIYYSVFRRFFEENYSIYHVLEHLPTIIMIIPMQAIAYAEALSVNNQATTWKEIFVVLLGQATDDKTFFSFVGFIYSAIVISMILSIFPAESVKRGNPDTLIIGAGDVVKKRLLPAILKREENMPSNKRGIIKIYSLEKEKIINLNDEIKKQWCKMGHSENEAIHSVFNLIKEKKTSNDNIAWICTPSNLHWLYLTIMQEKADYFVVEKPIASGIEDLNEFKKYIDSDKRKNTFFLSYYLLDKALPITFLSRPSRVYLEYLSGYVRDKGKRIELAKEESEEMIENYYENYLEANSSGVKSFEMKVIEGEDNRLLPRGGQLIETFIHHCIIASLFVGFPNNWKKQEFIHNSEDKIELKAQNEIGAKIKLLLEKNSNNKAEQSANIEFENGTIINACFETNEKYALLKNSKREEFIVGVSSNYLDKYDVQCNMVYDCYENKIDLSFVDGLYHQIEVLEWLLNVKKSDSN